MKRAGKMLVIGLFSLLLSGCMFTTPETSLYRLPKLAGEYESLESQIDALLTNGAEYAAPTSGSNLQSVQMIDLGGGLLPPRERQKADEDLHLQSRRRQLRALRRDRGRIEPDLQRELRGSGRRRAQGDPGRLQEQLGCAGACHLSALSRHVGVAFDDGLFPLREPRHERRREAGTFNYLQRRREYGARRLLRLG